MEYKMIDYEKYFKWIEKRLNHGLVYEISGKLDKNSIVFRLKKRYKLDDEIAWVVADEFEKIYNKRENNE
jgi:hypothetical protein